MKETNVLGWERRYRDAKQNKKCAGGKPPAWQEQVDNMEGEHELPGKLFAQYSKGGGKSTNISEQEQTLLTPSVYPFNQYLFIFV